MSTPVDLTNLRSMTDGDRDMEKLLFDEFYSSFEAGIKTLKANTLESAGETWRKEAHALKGIALNLGADHLGALCKTAQESHHIATSEKMPMLEKIEAEYARVKVFLSNIR